MRFRLMIYMILLFITTGLGCILWAIKGQPIDYKTAGILIMIGGVLWFIFIMYLEERLEEAEIELKGIYRDYYFTPKGIHKGQLISPNTDIIKIPRK